MLQFVKGQFYEFQESTIGAAFLTQSVLVGDATVKFEIWDTAGQERYHSLAPMYYRGAAAAVVVYDVTNRQSFVRAQAWVKELQRQGSPDIIIALAGNKIDLDAQQEVFLSEVEEYAQAEGDAVFVLETSAKTGQNVTEVFMEIARRLPKDMGSGAAATPLFPLDDPIQRPAGNCC